MNPLIVITERDNVATALETLAPGRLVQVGDVAITVLETVPRGHKVALREIGEGEPVVKYGSAIGTASAVIARGAHVHTHNLASARGRGDLARASQTGGPQSADQARIAEPPDESLNVSTAGSR